MVVTGDSSKRLSIHFTILLYLSILYISLFKLQHSHPPNGYNIRRVFGGNDNNNDNLFPHQKWYCRHKIHCHLGNNIVSHQPLFLLSLSKISNYFVNSFAILIGPLPAHQSRFHWLIENVLDCFSACHLSYHTIICVLAKLSST